MTKRSSSFWEYDGKLQASPGSRITDAVPEAIERHARGGPFAFDFNGITITVKHDSDPALILRDWERAMSGKIGKCVGPYPAAELSEAERASDAHIEAANEARRNAQQAEWARRDAESAPPRTPDSRRRRR